MFWTTDTRDPWIGQTNDTSDGIDAAVCGDDQLHYYGDYTNTSSLHIFVMGPGELSFNWKQCIPFALGHPWIRDADFQLTIDDIPVVHLNRTNEWTHFSMMVSSGKHRISWRATKAFSIAGHLNTSSFLLDQVNWTGKPTDSMVNNDFDGDGVTDMGVYYGPTGNWYLKKSRDGFEEITFGFAETIPVTGDYDGDYKSDLAVYSANDGRWYFLCSLNGFKTSRFGFPGTIPFSEDFDGDGRDDFGVYYPPWGMWYIMCSKVGFRKFQFGFKGTLPSPGDFDGDGKADLCLFHDASGMWYQQRSLNGFHKQQFGFSGVSPLVADYDGDFKDDLGCYYRGLSYLMQSKDGFQIRGQESCFPIWEEGFAGALADGKAYVGRCLYRTYDYGLSWNGGTFGCCQEFGFRGAVPVISTIVGGLSAQLEYRDGRIVRGGEIFLGKTRVLNGLVVLSAEPDEYYYFTGWNDGNTEPHRMVRATGRAKCFVPMFKHKLEGTWQGTSGTGQVPTKLVLNSHYRGELIWPNGDVRSVEWPYYEGDGDWNYSALGIEGGDVWNWELSNSDNHLTGKGRKWWRNPDTGESEHIEYDIDLRRQ